MTPFDAYMGLRIIESPSLTLPPREDWSQVRSPGRARRRRRQGHPQRIRIIIDPNPNALVMGDTVVMHPATAARFRAMIPEKGRGRG